MATAKSPIKLGTLLQFARGSGKIMEVLECAENPIQKRLVLMDTPGHDAESVSGLLLSFAKVMEHHAVYFAPSPSPLPHRGERGGGQM